MKPIHMPIPLALAAALLACGEEAPVWDDIPLIEIDVGGAATVDLDDYVDDPDGSDELLLVTVYGGSSATIAASINASTHVVTFSGAARYEGAITFEVVATDPDGNSASGFVTVSAGGGVNPGEVPSRSCATTFTYDGNAGSVAVAGEFNGWSTTADLLTDNNGDGVWEASLEVAEGHHQYKLVLDGDTWILDPANPYQAWDGGFVNSVVDVPDCSLPLASIVDVNVGAGRLRGSVQYYLGDGQTAMPTALPLRVTVAGDAVNVDVDAQTGLGTFDVPALADGKYTVRAAAARGDGTLGPADVRPLWVEDTPFDWRDAILYFAMTDRFFDGDPANNDPYSDTADIANYDGGDWEGIAQKIDEGYFDELGVDVIWISPIRDNPDHSELGADGRNYTGYHGYWPKTNTPDEHFGGAAGLHELVATAHAHGIRIMLDLVANHVHDEHPWYGEHPEWFNEFDWCGDGNSWDLNPIGCWFTEYLPDLDFQNEDALFGMHDASLALMETYDLDAVRLDAVKHMETVFERNLVASLTARLESAGVEVYTVGETFTGPWDGAGFNQGLIAEHIGEGLLDGQFDFPLYWEVVSTFARQEQDVSVLANMMADAEGFYGEDALMSNFLGNHDIPRFISHANGDIFDKWGNGAQEQGWNNPPPQPTASEPYERLRLAYTFLMSVEGVPLIYYGDEIGLAGAGDPDNRRFMQWSGLSAQQTQTRAHVSALTAIRKAHPALSRGQHTPLMADQTGMAFGRTTLGDKAVVVLNRAAGQRTFNLDVSGLGLDNGDVLVDELGGGQVMVSGGHIQMTLQARLGAIYVPQ